MASKLNHAARAHHPESAGRHLVHRVPIAYSDDSIAAVRGKLVGATFDYADAIYLVDAEKRLVGAVPLLRLLAAGPEQPIKSIAIQPAPAVTPETDQERVASLAIHHGLTAVPVVDDQKRFLGVVPPLSLLQVLRHEHVEDLHRLAGIRRETTRARSAFEAPPMRRVRDRLPWLLVGLAGSMLATFVVANFEATLQSKVAIAFFVPGIVYLADAIGTQTEAIAVRGLSLSHAPIGTLIGAELRTGLLIGVILGALSFPLIWLWFSDARLALAVSAALWVAGTVATTIGLLLPWLFSQAGRDPAFGSGPIGTIIQDVLSLVIYFVIVRFLLF